MDQNTCKFSYWALVIKRVNLNVPLPLNSKYSLHLEKRTVTSETVPMNPWDGEGHRDIKAQIRTLREQLLGRNNSAPVLAVYYDSKVSYVNGNENNGLVLRLLPQLFLVPVYAATYVRLAQTVTVCKTSDTLLGTYHNLVPVHYRLPNTCVRYQVDLVLVFISDDGWLYMQGGDSSMDLRVCCPL